MIVKRVSTFFRVRQVGLTSQLVLGTRNLLGVWEVKTLSNQHNAQNEVEADRVQKEHPDEEECIHESRTLGLITVTRDERL